MLRPYTHLVLAVLATCVFSSCVSHWANEPVDEPENERESMLADYEEARSQGRDGEEERQKLEYLVVKYPRHTPLLMTNAILAYDAAEPEKAQRYLDALLAHEPANANASAMRARLALERGNIRLANRLLDEAIEYHPANEILFETRAAVAYYEGNFEKARTALDRAEKFGSPKWRTAFHRGLVAEATGDERAAMNYYRAAVQNDPYHEQARERLLALETQ